MKFIKFVILFLTITFLSCIGKTNEKDVTVRTTEENNFVKPDTFANEQIKLQENLFKLDIKINENFVKIIPPKNSDFELPDSEAKTEPFKFGDFNADRKEDILVYLGACGTGGCMYGLFLKQYDNYYKLAFMDYLKNAEFEIEKNGLWKIETSEEIEPYNPSKLQKTIFTFDKNKNQYKLDTTYVYIEK